MLQLKAFLVLAMAMLVVACETVPQNFGERLAAAYSTNTEVRLTAAQAVRNGHLSREQGQAVLNLTDRVRTLLDEAADGDERGLDLAIEILEQLERMVQ